jgi:hypothetical protein
MKERGSRVAKHHQTRVGEVELGQSATEAFLTLDELCNQAHVDPGKGDYGVHAI